MISQSLVPQYVAVNYARRGAEYEPGALISFHASWQVALSLIAHSSWDSRLPDSRRPHVAPQTYYPGSWNAITTVPSHILGLEGASTLEVLALSLSYSQSCHVDGLSAMAIIRDNHSEVCLQKEAEWKRVTDKAGRSKEVG